MAGGAGRAGNPIDQYVATVLWPRPLTSGTTPPSGYRHQHVSECPHGLQFGTETIIAAVAAAIREVQTSFTWAEIFPRRRR